MPVRASAAARNSSTDLPVACARCASSSSCRSVRGVAGMDHVDVDAVAHAELGQSLRRIRQRRIDRAADGELGLRRARGAADDVDDVALRRLQHRPEQPREPDGGVILEREAVEERLVGQFQEIAGAGAPGVVHEDVAAAEFLFHLGGELLAVGKLAQVAGDGKRLKPHLRDHLRGGGKIVGRGRRDHGLRALARERHRDPAPDAAAAAGDDRDLALKFSCHIHPSILAGFAISYLPGKRRS